MVSLATGCSTPIDEPTRERLYERTYTVFSEAHLRRPAPGSAGERVENLAPLLLLQTDPTAERAPEGPKVVYYTESSVDIGDRRYEQITYLWSDPGPKSPERYQGLRLTLGDDGFPLTYEVLRDSSGARLIFVAAALEQRASDEFGAPAPGRRFSIENGVDIAPNVIVPSILEPGPVPLGPFVYLGHDSRDVATMICRCTASQVDRVLSSEEYVLEARDEEEPVLYRSSESLTSLLRLPPQL